MSRVGAKIAGLLLAAGSSTRMGSPKQLLHVQGVTLLERILNEALKSELHKIILILGHQSKEIKKSTGPNHCPQKTKSNRESTIQTGYQFFHYGWFVGG
jgi:molybdenum cofactor cytidylyltransferase